MNFRPMLLHDSQPKWSANCFWVMPRGTRYSSRRISPGVVGIRDRVVFVMETSVVVANVHVAWTPSCPPEDDSPLIVDPDAVESPKIALERLQPIPRRRRKVLERVGVVQHVQLPCGDPPHCSPSGTPRHAPGAEEELDITMGEALDRHEPQYTGWRYTAQRGVRTRTAYRVSRICRSRDAPDRATLQSRRRENAGDHLRELLDPSQQLYRLPVGDRLDPTRHR